MKKFLSGLIALLLTSLALAASTNGTQTATVSWTAPTQYTDGTALAATDIASYTVTYQTATSAVKSLTVPAGTLTTTVAALCGTANFSVTVTTTATAVYPNATSSPAGPVPFVSSVNCVPNSPSGLTVK